jgi:hypothetical protein
MKHTGDPLGLYRLPRDSQVAILSLYAPPPRVDVPVEDDLEFGDPDPEFGRTLSRLPYMQAANTEARERSDRFRVA